MWALAARPRMRTAAVRTVIMVSTISTKPEPIPGEPQAVEVLGRDARLLRRERGVVWNQRWTLLPSADCSR
jgi:hypothetical protein